MLVESSAARGASRPGLQLKWWISAVVCSSQPMGERAGKGEGKRREENP